MWMITMFMAHSSMASTGRMTFYYYLQIVPSQRALLIWIKRNIKSFIYTIFPLDEIIMAFSAFLKIVSVIPECWAVRTMSSTGRDGWPPALRRMERRRMEGAHGTLLRQRLKIVTNQRIGRGKDL